MSPAEDIIPEEAAASPVIVVAEDEVLVRMAIAEHLRACGFTVVEAASGDEARAVILSGIAVDLVFSDIQMPGEMDGIALAQWLASNHPEIPVVLASGAAATLAVGRVSCARVRAFMSKPYDYDVLSRSFREHIARRARRG